MQFIKTLKGNSLKKALTGFILIVVICGAVFGFLAWSMGALGLITGPANITDLDLEGDLEGKYVEIEIPLVWDVYAWVGESYITGHDRVEEMYYMVFTPDWEYLIGVGIRDKDDLDVFEELVDAQWEGYYDAETDMYDLDYVVEPITVRGTLQPITGKYKTYYDELLDEYDYNGHAIDYYVDVNRLGEWSMPTWYLVVGVIAFLLLVGIYNLTMAASGMRQRKLKKYTATLGDEGSGAEALDRWAESANHIGKTIWISPELVVWQEGAKTRFLDMTSVVWAYRRITRTNGIETSNQLMLGTMQKKERGIPAKANLIAEMLNYIEMCCPDIAMGHTPELRGIFRKDPGLLRQIARQQRVRDASNTPPSPYGPAAGSEPTKGDVINSAFQQAAQTGTVSTETFNELRKHADAEPVSPDKPASKPEDNAPEW